MFKDYQHTSPQEDLAQKEQGVQPGASGGSAGADHVPSISLPKGGGAIRGIGEKFAANPVTGTGSMTIPIATSAGRSGFGPQLSISYDSGAGNGPFGLGWNLSLPSITRRTDRGLPKYQDADESDVFILFGAEDLVPELDVNQQRIRSQRQVGGKDFTVYRYRPRIEGLFARIERWVRLGDGDTHWRSISKDNLLTIYGRNEESRIANPEDKLQVFSWLICETRDDKGNGIVYGYVSENAANVDLAQANEKNRGNLNSPHRKANCYLKRIKYGNKAPLLDENRNRPTFLTDDQRNNATWMFEVVFDYGDEDYTERRDNGNSELVEVSLDPARAKPWPVRSDPFSSYRAGYEVRTYRLCQRVLMFHHFPNELGTPDYLVRATEFNYMASPVASPLTSVTQSGFKRRPDGTYLRKSLPPVEFTYSPVEIHDEIREIDAASLENLPLGIDGSGYQWVDLDGEGLSGVLTEQAGTWFYKRNISPISFEPAPDRRQAVRFQALERIEQQPALITSRNPEHQFLDLAGDGSLDLVEFGSALPGFYERTTDGNWENFRAFDSVPNVRWNDPNLRFVDLTGDGHADVLITEDEVITWYLSLAEDGFGPAARVPHFRDEEKGPFLVLADGTQSIFLADMSGDGLTDLVRIRNGAVCYWPNLGYGRFGAKVTMDASPWFDAPDQFDQRRLRVADIDGSGATDIIYLGRQDTTIFLNQSGNRWTDGKTLNAFPQIDNLAAVQVADLFGNGTACLVWSSPLPGANRQPMRYLDLMGGQKPHLLIKTANNLGAETSVSYAPSTKFYLQDKFAGKPWITRLPFPVHCVETVTITDKWRQTVFSTTYSYHHGYFDGLEREFRGFGRVEQVDAESYGEFVRGNSASPFITDDKTLYQPPVRTVTWYHTGAMFERERILAQFENEYFPHWLKELKPKNVLGDFREIALPEPDVEAKNSSGAAEDLSADEWREALRACKGMMLRQEVCELDVDALERGDYVPVKLFSTAYHNCHIRRLQPKAINQHAVFLVAESQAISYHYELDLREDSVNPDPRVAHTLNLQFDEYASVLQSVAVVYPRLGQFEDDTLQIDALPLIDRVQKEPHLAYTETRNTNDVDEPDSHRLRVPCEVLTYELTGINAEGTTAQPRYFTLDELRRLRLSLVHQSVGENVPEIAYHQLPKQTSPEKRLVEHVRMLFFKDDAAILNDPFPFRQIGRLGMVFETYKLALTDALFDAVFKEPSGNKLDQIIGGATARSRLNDPVISAYLSGTSLATRFDGIDTTGQYWIRSGIAGFATDAAQHFYLPERYTDPFGNVTTLEFEHDLLVRSSTDAMGNTTRVTQFDFRVLAPREMQDINDNLSEVFFDVLGLPTAMAVKGNGTEGDDLTGFTDDLANPSLAQLSTFFNEPDLDEAQARTWLANSTARHVYHFGETRNTNGTTSWATHPACACGILREQHVSQLAPGERSSLQTAFEYSDGVGSVVVKKVQAEPERVGQPLRWIANGKTVLNNKGKPVKQYEPYFSPPEVGHRFEEPREEGVTAIIYYDAAGRTVRTEMPDGSFSRVEFSPWHVRSFDQNDTVKEPGNAWFTNKTSATATVEEKRAAQLAAEHADTPSLTILDSLGREVVSIAHNRVRNTTGGFIDEKYLTFTRLDAEGKPLWIRDARKNLVMQYITPPVPNDQAADPVADFAPCYDIAGNLLFQHSMDAGDRWTLNDAAGKPMVAWNSRGHLLHTDYDSLHRPVGSFVTGADPFDATREIQFEKIIYGDTLGNGLADPKSLNLRGQPYKHHDTVGIVISMAVNLATGANEAFDFKGNLLRSTRQLVSDYKNTPDWSQNPGLEAETFSSSTRYDALNRPIQLVAPHSDQVGTNFNIIRPGYNEAALLERMDVWLEQSAEPTTLLNPVTATINSVTNIDYNAKGQRETIEYGNGVRTEYNYDTDTFRLLQLLTTRSSNTQLQSLNYTYDPVGNITTIRDEAQQTVFFNNTVIEASNAYVYDPLYRLVRAEGREHAAQNNEQRDQRDFERTIGIPFPNSPEALQRYVEEYEYDPVGNILGMRHTGGAVERWIRRYQYALDSNRLLATRLPGDPNNLPKYTATPGYSARYTYDVHGNMTSMPHLPTMEWDFKDQLRATSRQLINDTPPPDTVPEMTFYVYDGSGQRVRKVTERQNGSRKVERIYLAGFEIFREYDGVSINRIVTLERETLHVMDDKQRVTLIETRTRLVGDDPAPRQLVRYQLGNHLGSAALELDDQAQLISYEEYHPYGTTAYRAARSQTETPKRYCYTGKERDEETGFTYHGARYYAPWLVRWTSCDPVGLVDSPNSYMYVSGNPLLFHDGDGHQEEQVWLMQQRQLTISPVATRGARGITDLQRGALRGLDYGFGPGTGSHWGHPAGQSFVTQPAGTAVTLTAEPATENLRKANASKLEKAAAQEQGKLFRTDSVDTTVPKGSRYTQPSPEPFENPLAAYDTAVKTGSPPKFLPPEEAFQLSLPSLQQGKPLSVQGEQLSFSFEKPPAIAKPLVRSVPIRTGAEAAKGRISVGGVAEGAAAVGGIAILAYEISKAKTAQGKSEVIKGALKAAPVGIALSAVGLGSVAIPLVAIEGTKILMKENVIPESTQRAIGKTVVEKAFKSSAADTEIIETIAVPDSIPLIGGWRPFAPN
jgi:RHS repeat-associated protein